MCGISAVLSQGPAPSSGENSPLGAQLSESLDQIQHRGPDARGEWTSDDGKVRMSSLSQCLEIHFSPTRMLTCP